MSNEEMQKKIGFIIEQQAQLMVNQEKADERLTRMENIIVRFYEDTETKIGALIDAQVRTETKMAELAEAQIRTDERLNKFVTVIERFINKGRNGQLHS